MKPAPKYLKIAGLVSLLILPAIFLLIFSTARHNFTKLPVYGNKEAVTRQLSGKTVTDTLYHTIPPFSLTSQDNRTITEKDLQGRIYVADFFFTTCGTICPKMTKQMVRLNWKLKDHAFSDVMLVSHTVDPETDTPAVLKKYAASHEADEKRWIFLTGDKQQIYELGVNGYLISASEDVLAPGGFLHSEKFVLVDKKGRIRGFYDGTSTEEVDKLADDIKLLLKEEKIEARDLKEKK